MLTVQVKKLSADDYRVMPWKNGGGVTTEIARFPPPELPKPSGPPSTASGATTSPTIQDLLRARFQKQQTSSDFMWRVSSARVEGSGPFSDFRGYERLLSYLTGPGMRLSMERPAEEEEDGPGEGEEASELITKTLDAPYQVVRFQGEWKTSCDLMAAGPCRDFNVIVERAVARGTITNLRWDQCGPEHVPAAASPEPSDTPVGRLVAEGDGEDRALGAFTVAQARARVYCLRLGAPTDRPAFETDLAAGEGKKEDNGPEAGKDEDEDDEGEEATAPPPPPVEAAPRAPETRDSYRLRPAVPANEGVLIVVHITQRLPPA
ncbi:putative HutD [Paratrimastix pyriformis]|uniref:HutD n=1 Tax=Paratrimastix pyriformis TaxID=342808 RepID=A0ABQ8UST3_9EUKA|nr:putative HutD [Paratrimastix pyriformis]